MLTLFSKDNLLEYSFDRDRGVRGRLSSFSDSSSSNRNFFSKISIGFIIKMQVFVNFRNYSLSDVYRKSSIPKNCIYLLEKLLYIKFFSLKLTPNFEKSWTNDHKFPPQFFFFNVNFFHFYSNLLIIKIWPHFSKSRGQKNLKSWPWPHVYLSKMYRLDRVWGF